MGEPDLTSFESGWMHAWQTGFLAVPGALLLHYKSLGLTEEDVMILLHLMFFRQHEHKDFPSWEELRTRMSIPQQQIIASLHRLIKQGYLSIDERIDETSGVRYEAYNWTPLMARLAAAVQLYAAKPSSAAAPSAHPVSSSASETAAAAGQPASGSSTAASGASTAAGPVSSPAGAPFVAGSTDVGPHRPPAPIPAPPEQEATNLYSIFEQEFARPLSPMEYETITGWIERDRYPEPLIVLALKEAVFAGKVNFRYIDRILLEWQRNSIRTVEQAKAYAQRFRGR